MTDKYPTVYLQGGDTQAEFVIANPELPGGAYVPVSELRELIEQWRERYHEDDPYRKVENRGERYAANECADELEAVLDD